MKRLYSHSSEAKKRELKAKLANLKQLKHGVDPASLLNKIKQNPEQKINAQSLLKQLPKDPNSPRGIALRDANNALKGIHLDQINTAQELMTHATTMYTTTLMNLAADAAINGRYNDVRAQQNITAEKAEAYLEDLHRSSKIMHKRDTIVGGPASPYTKSIDETIKAIKNGDQASPRDNLLHYLQQKMSSP